MPDPAGKPILVTIMPVAAALLVLVVVAALIAWRSPAVLPRPSSFEPDRFSTTEMNLLQAGDLVFRRGPGLPSDLIVTYLHDGTGLSHGAMLLPGAGPGQWLVVQSINGSFNGVDGVQAQDLESFCRDNLPGSLVLVRPRWPEAAREAALAQAEALLKEHRVFDNNYDFADRSALYCSELLWALVAETAVWQPTPRPVMSGPLLSFRTFLVPESFRVAISHNPMIPAD